MAKEEPINVVKQMIADGQVSQEVAEKYFPELADSDEKIRKLLIRKITQERGTLSNDEATKCIAWLEKRGEKESVTCPICGWEIETQSKQKDADKAEPKFKIGDKIIEKDFDECGRGTIIDIKDGKYIFDDGGFICIEEQNLWKLVEQKPTEWSEEDESRITVICTYLQDYARLSGCESRTIRINEYCDWLKSIKYQSHWKPSDEQMKYLAKAITTLGNEGDCKTALILNDLRLELKKLKEE